MTVVLQCPRCGEVWRYESPPDQEFVSVYCLCSSAPDARHTDMHSGVRMIVLDTAAAEPALAAS